MGWEAVYAKGHYGDPDYVITELVKNDPGGATKFGIDQRDHPAIDVKSLDLNGAMIVFHDGTRDLHGVLEGGEWTRIRGDDLSDSWSLALFDCAINPGMVAVHWAQEILGLVSDGKLGPKTIAAVNAAQDRHLVAFLMKRDAYYLSRGPWANDFRAGWLD